MNTGPSMHATIVALSSAPGRAGVAVIRVSGPAARQVLEITCGCVPEPRRASLRSLRDSGGQPIDRGLVLFFPGPQSFTGEDLAEFHVHGGRAVVAAVLGAIGAVAGCRLAEAGEFAMRAFRNGKLDLAQAEGLADLIDAETDAQRRQALDQAEGGLSALTEAWRRDLVAAMALMEAAIDFSDEADVSEGAVAQASEIVQRLAGDIDAHLADGHRGEIVREGFKVVLAGAPNAGKSSLMNALTRRDVAIVSAEAGTTRDVIEVRLDLDGVGVVISDTAGLRSDARSEVELEGMRRTLARTKAADLVVWVVDASSPTSNEPQDVLSGEGDMSGRRAMIVFNKSDIAGSDFLDRMQDPAGTQDALALSAKTGEGIGRLTRRLSELALEATGAGAQQSAVITQARHRQHIGQCCEHLHRYLARDSDVELRAEDLRLAADALGRITGRVDPEDVLDQVFGRFCIGK